MVVMSSEQKQPCYLIVVLQPLLSRLQSITVSASSKLNTTLMLLFLPTVMSSSFLLYINALGVILTFMQVRRNKQNKDVQETLIPSR